MPASTVRGAVIRPTWMSRSAVSRADADGEHRHARRLERQQRRLERAPLVSAPSLTTTSPASGTPASCWRAWSSAGRQARVGAGEGQIAAPVGAGRQAAREAKRPHREALAQRPAQPAVGGAELLLHVGAARLAVDVGDAHAARVVEQHADDVLVRHGGAQHQHRPEQAQQQQADERGCAARSAPSGRGS